MAKREWRRVKPLTKEQKAEIAAICDRFIAESLKPRFLPQIRPTEFNYPVDITGKWRGHRYSFIVRYRSGFPETRDQEFDAPFVRLDHCENLMDPPRFDVMWLRHTGKWWPLYDGCTLEEALALMQREEVLKPPT